MQDKLFQDLRAFCNTPQESTSTGTKTPQEKHGMLLSSV